MKMQTSNIPIKGQTGTWYVIDEGHYKGRKVFLLESELYGEDAACLVVGVGMNIIMDDVWNGLSELEAL